MQETKGLESIRKIAEELGATVRLVKDTPHGQIWELEHPVLDHKMGSAGETKLPVGMPTVEQLQGLIAKEMERVAVELNDKLLKAYRGVVEELEQQKAAFKREHEISELYLMERNEARASQETPMDELTLKFLKGQVEQAHQERDVALNLQNQQAEELLALKSDNESLKHNLRSAE